MNPHEFNTILHEKSNKEEISSSYRLLAFIHSLHSHCPNTHLYKIELRTRYTDYIKFIFKQNRIFINHENHC